MTRTTHQRSALQFALRRVSTAAILVAIGLSAAGCGLTKKKHVEMTSTVPTDYRLRHPITIQERDAAMEVFVGQRRGGLTPAQRADVHRFAEVWRSEASGGILIDVPHGTPNARTAAETARDVRNALGQAGVPARAIATRRYTPNDETQLATVRVRYPKLAAQAGPCGLWPEDLALPHDSQPTMNRPYWNLGCANQRNLAAMVENPTDLVQPRSETRIYGPRRARVLDQYRQGQNPATNYPTTRAISDL